MACRFWFDFASTYACTRPRCVSAGSPARPVSRSAFRPFLLGPIFKAHGWNTSPFNFTRPKAAICGATSSGLAMNPRLPFRRPGRFRNRACWRRVLPRWSGPHDVWGKDFCVAVFRAEFADGEPIGEPATMRAILADLKVDPQRTMTAAQSDVIKERLRSQTAEAQRLEIFGAPTFSATARTANCSMRGRGGATPA